MKSYPLIGLVDFRLDMEQSIINGKHFSRDELISNIADQAEKFDTRCAVVSKTMQSLPKFERKFAKFETRHANRAAGVRIFNQLHVGIDHILTPEERRAAEM